MAENSPTIITKTAAILKNPENFDNGELPLFRVKLAINKIIPIIIERTTIISTI
jgi:hypothetical protein